MRLDHIRQHRGGVERFVTTVGTGLEFLRVADVGLMQGRKALIFNIA